MKVMAADAVGSLDCIAMLSHLGMTLIYCAIPVWC
jgi:hypothetical protein